MSSLPTFQARTPSFQCPSNFVFWPPEFWLMLKNVYKIHLVFSIFLSSLPSSAVPIFPSFPMHSNGYLSTGLLSWHLQHCDHWSARGLSWFYFCFQLFCFLHFTLSFLSLTFGNFLTWLMCFFLPLWGKLEIFKIWIDMLFCAFLFMKVVFLYTIHSLSYLFYTISRY